jgi:hypothetical protein
VISTAIELRSNGAHHLLLRWLYFLPDGFHGVEAARRLGWSEIDAEILLGTLQDMEAEFREMLNVLKANLRRK